MQAASLTSVKSRRRAVVGLALHEQGVAAGVEEDPVATLALDLLPMSRLERVDRRAQGAAL